MEYLVNSDLSILNHGNEPTFVVCNRKEVIDLTPGTNKIVNLVCNWHVSDKPPFSDHRYICFYIGNKSTYFQESQKNQQGIIQRRPKGDSGNLIA
jgi:hypothetical protein